jgi:CRP/FNR family transcriptional regulator, cyclic AMP receptor protein
MADFKNLKTNELLFSEGDIPDNMYIVRKGQISIFNSKNGIENQLAIVGPGELIGELALFDKKQRSASAKALSDASVVILPYAQLERQMDTLPDWVKITMKTMAEKLRVTNQKLLDRK